MRIGRPAQRGPAGQLGLAVARPVGLEQVPLLGGTTDVVLEVAGDLLGDPGHVRAKRAGAGGVDRGRDDGVVVDPGPAVDAVVTRVAPVRRARVAGPGREGGALAEELDLDAVADEVPVTQEADQAARRAAP